MKIDDLLVTIRKQSTVGGSVSQGMIDEPIACGRFFGMNVKLDGPDIAGLELRENVFFSLFGIVGGFLLHLVVPQLVAIGCILAEAEPRQQKQGPDADFGKTVFHDP